MTARLIHIPARRTRSNNAEVAHAIGIGIVAGRHLPGTRLPGDAEMLLRFGVSRPVLREGIKTLAAKGLLTSRARIGTVVQDRSAWNMFDPDVLAWHLEAGVGTTFLQDLAEIRLAVEPRTAALAARRRTGADLDTMRASLRQMHDAPSDTPGFADGDLALHVAIANASGNPFMRGVGAVIEAALRASFLLSAPVQDADRERVLTAHGRIVTAIEHNDMDAASEAMTAVILNGLDRHGALDNGSLDPGTTGGTTGGSADGPPQGASAHQRRTT